MTPIVKDPENAAAPTAPGIPAPPSAGVPARPQPVALEVPVTVNGARSADGSDKREPFSERSQTVLVFGHGAVLRISALLAPGQLVFLTNEKTKKEVVCVVVKSKTDGNAVGYVELRFTEPAPGFWGMRFPSDTVLPQAATRPIAPAPAPAPPKGTPMAPPVAVKPVVAALPIAVKPVTAVPPAPASAASEIPKTTAPPIQAAPPVALPSARATEPAVSSVASSPLFAPAESKAVLPSSTGATSTSAHQSTDELKQQAARLQEQLSALLFAEATKPSASTPEPILENTTAPELAQKVLDLTNFTPAPVATQPVKSVAPPPKAGSSSLEVEEIKIPAWLAPLARESETPTAVHSSSVESDSFAELDTVVAEATENGISSEAQESAQRPEVAMFGGQLLGESAQASDSAGSGSKTGLFLGIAASLLLIAGGVWYSRQPGNAISSMLGGSTTASQPAAAPEVEPAPSVAKHVSHPEAPVAASSSSPSPALVNPPAPLVSAAVKNTPAGPATRNTSSIATPSSTPSSTPSPRSTPPVEEPKKPALGDVRLAKPLVGRGKSTSAPGESEPSIDVSANENNSAPLSGLTRTHRNEPSAPIPIGGDVKAAKLLKSVQPVYPQMARSQHVSGNVQIDALIDADGNVGEMKVLSGPALLRDAALQSLKQWKYQPAELDGKPTSMHLTVTLQFRAQ
ncbi:MAG TPA: TonB family protein [Candidatus Sulfotelmatobacter sp.]|jgi:protein TonB|nr:TonB family protein [Candidatus Sulfotelmatobacter sp.]